MEEQYKSSSSPKEQCDNFERDYSAQMDHVNTLKYMLLPIELLKLQYLLEQIDDVYELKQIHDFEQSKLNCPVSEESLKKEVKELLKKHIEIAECYDKLHIELYNVWSSSYILQRQFRELEETSLPKGYHELPEYLEMKERHSDMAAKKAVWYSRRSA
jgi:hypothetical protein